MEGHIIAGRGGSMDAKEFWRAIGCRAVGAAVVTAKDANGPRGFLGLSATHLSAEPPRLMVAVDARTRALGTIRNARHFAINYLRADQHDIAELFGGKGERRGAERFDAAAWTELQTGAPVLRHALGVLDCDLDEAIERGSTTIVIGRLVAHAASSAAGPLVSFNGKWKTLNAAP
jgi:flavin reductase (DIM6/NTAB) family NADH-FMN oxidoreductase RutF